MRMWRFLDLLFLGTAGIVMLTVWFFPTDIRFGVQNPFWNGLKDFEKEFHATPLGLLPSALAAYNHQEAVLVTGPLHPRETLKHALRVSGEIALVRREERLLAPPNLLRLRRSAQNLRGNGSGGPRGTLGEVLQREIEALEDLARGHPLTSTLLSGLRGSPPPATITVISRWNHDAEALAVTLPRLQGQGYRVLEIGSRS
jgi:hypothetical protein